MSRAITITVTGDWAAAYSRAVTRDRRVIQRRRRLAVARALVVTSLLVGGVAVSDAAATTGALTQKTGTAGCISETGHGGDCATGTALTSAVSVTVSPDGANAYAASLSSGAVVVFDRDPSTGELTQKTGTAGCISETGSGGDCATGTAIDGASSVTVSPDGANAYAAAVYSGAVVVFDRDPSTGELTQKTGTAGCISQTGSGGDCATGTALNYAISVTISPDGTNAYAAAAGSGAVVVFDRDPSTGELTQKTGTAGCISQTGHDGDCATGTALAGAYSVTVSPDGANAYAASAISDAVVVFDRDPSTGALTQKTGTAGCISQTGGDCATGTALDGAVSVT
ncbi:MAG: beta-propeller fold lactonase family protein, partial [Solirubrobacteraceae bacterium]|nr:beta-propeller fold lactonase family protein [Solirubrobacteraceae bacterium]